MHFTGGECYNGGVDYMNVTHSQQQQLMTIIAVWWEIKWRLRFNAQRIPVLLCARCGGADWMSIRVPDVSDNYFRIRIDRLWIIRGIDRDVLVVFLHIRPWRVNFVFRPCVCANFVRMYQTVKHCSKAAKNHPTNGITIVLLNNSNKFSVLTRVANLNTYQWVRISNSLDIIMIN